MEEGLGTEIIQVRFADFFFNSVVNKYFKPEMVLEIFGSIIMINLVQCNSGPISLPFNGYTFGQTF